MFDKYALARRIFFGKFDYTHNTMKPLQLQEKLTEEDYFFYEETSELKHEFIT